MGMGHCPKTIKTQPIPATSMMAQNVDLYGYRPSEVAAILGVAVFGSLMLACVVQVVFGRYKHYWMLTLAIAALGEAIGWAGRLWAHFQVCYLVIPYDFR
jgi:hypothetical protein